MRPTKDLRKLLMSEQELDRLHPDLRNPLVWYELVVLRDPKDPDPWRFTSTGKLVPRFKDVEGGRVPFENPEDP